MLDYMIGRIGTGKRKVSELPIEWIHDAIADLKRGHYETPTVVPPDAMLERLLLELEIRAIPDNRL